MTLRSLFALTLTALFLAPATFALEKGKADGEVVINRKPVKLKYAFAKKQKDFDENDQWVVMLTDRAVSKSLLNDSNRLDKAVKGGQLVVVVLQFDKEHKLSQAEARSKVLEHAAIPMSPMKMKLTGIAFGNESLDGAAATTEDEEFFSDVVTLDAKFSAPLAADRFGENALAAKELAASGPKLADGTAAGTMTIDGASVKLAYAIARSKPNVFDEKKKDVEVLLSDQQLPAETFADDRKLFEAMNGGAIKGLVVTIDDEEKPYHVQILHPATSLQLSGSGIFEYDSFDYSQKHAAGRFFTNGMEDFGGGSHKYAYDVTFAVPVQTIVRPAEVTLDASNGTKLPAGGGEPGKAYMAFDKAARSGNIAEMKKLGSKTNPMPEMKPEELNAMIELIKIMRPAKVKVTGGFTSGDHATLSVEGERDSKKTTGTIEMQKEDGGWHLLGEKWSS